jgi:DNA-binding LacI/PurR family transcriptional regulator
MHRENFSASCCSCVWLGGEPKPAAFVLPAALLDVLDLAAPPTAIVAFNDKMAIGAYHAARKRGLRVPEDLSIVGFDDVELSRVAQPPLTTVRQPLEEMYAWPFRSSCV